MGFGYASGAGHGAEIWVLVPIVALFVLRIATAGRRGRNPGFRGGRGPRSTGMPGPAAPGAMGADAPSGTAQGFTAPPSGMAPPMILAGWYPDPAGRFDERYWSGVAWTNHVRRDGTVASDPFEATSSP